MKCVADKKWCLMAAGVRGTWKEGEKEVQNKKNVLSKKEKRKRRGESPKEQAKKRKKDAKKKKQERECKERNPDPLSHLISLLIISQVARVPRPFSLFLYLSLES